MVNKESNYTKGVNRMNKTKIEWAESTWNPVTGCLNGCPYCYARRIADRFAGCDADSTFGINHKATWKRVNPDSEQAEALFEVDAKWPPVNIKFDAKRHMQVSRIAPYPFGFQPTLRRDHLFDYAKERGRTIFVCSMADLFGEWVPDSWIQEVFAACERAPQHRYLFLTKNPARYIKLAKAGALPVRDNMWYGTTTTTPDDTFFYGGSWNTFVCIEPILHDYGCKPNHMCNDFAQWVIIGAETGNRKGKVVPEPKWIKNIVQQCDKGNISVFMKDSLVPIIGENYMIREIPWDKETRKDQNKAALELWRQIRL